MKTRQAAFYLAAVLLTFGCAGGQRQSSGEGKIRYSVHVITDSVDVQIKQIPKDSQRKGDEYTWLIFQRSFEYEIIAKQFTYIKVDLRQEFVDGQTLVVYDQGKAGSFSFGREGGKPHKSITVKGRFREPSGAEILQTSGE